MNSIINWIDRWNGWVGKGVAWLTLALVLIMVADVLMRYIFAVTSAGSAELEWHLFALIFMLSAGWTYQRDQHVRVDVFHQRFGPRLKAWIEILGILCLLLPFCVVGVIEGSRFAYAAYLLDETSSDAGGLPFRYLIKATIPLGFLLLGLQAISQLLKNVAIIKTSKK